MTRGGGELGKADMHLHTLYSDGTVSVGALLDHVEAETDLDVIAITDHERIDGALRAREMHAAGRYSFELVVGEEITTRRGHVLALFITERIPALRPLAETLERIHDQGGIAIAAHPMAPLTPSLGTRSLLAAARHRGSPSPARRDRADEPIGCGSGAPSGPPTDQSERPPPGCRRKLGCARAGGDRHRVDLVPRLDCRRLPEGRGRAHHAARMVRSGRTARTSRCTGDSCVPRSGTSGILFGQRESGGDIGAVGAVDDGAIGAVGRGLIEIP